MLAFLLSFLPIVVQVIQATLVFIQAVAGPISVLL